MNLNERARTPRGRVAAMKFGFMKLSVLLSMSAVAACSSTSSTAPSASGADAAVTPTSALDEDAGGVDAEPPSKCAAPPSASKCKNAGSWVRGIAKFDPSHFAAGSTPILRVTLRHQFALVSGEENIGGRLHAFKSFPIKKVASGEIAFAIDMCGLGTAMWSEENDPFNLIVHIDENDNNDLTTAMSNEAAVLVAEPDKGELVKLTKVDVSCHAASPCLEIDLDCADGAKCTTITPISTCKRRTPGCESDDSYCD